MFRTQVLRSSGEDVDLFIVGAVGVGGAPSEGLIFVPEAPAKTARMMSVTFSLESDLRALLYWDKSDGHHELLLPLEGRGSLDFTRYGGLVRPKDERGLTGAIGLRVESTKPGTQRHFTIALDLSKQRI